MKENSLDSPYALKKRLIPDASPSKILHSGTGEFLARPYLEQNTESMGALNKYFSHEGIWSPQVTHGGDIYTYDSRTIGLDFVAKTSDLYMLVQDSLGGINWFGYNDHGPAHITKVISRILDLGTQLELDEQILRRAQIAGVGHDLGNLFSRPIHSFISPDMVTDLFPQLLREKEEWKKIKEAIVIHDSVSYSKLLKAWSNAVGDELIEKVEKTLHPETLLLLIADKADIGRHRVNRKALNKSAIDVHKHSENSLIFRTESTDFTENEFVWNIVYDRKITKKELPAYQAIAINENEVYTSERIRLGNQTSFALAVQQLLHAESQRMNILFLAAFALNQDVETCRLTFTDVEAVTTKVIEIEKKEIRSSVSWI